MSETLVFGAINGLTIGLLAVGLVLVYKANRFINLAHAQLGTLSAVLLAKWVGDCGVTWWLAFPAPVFLSAVTWAIAGGLSAVTAVLLAPSQATFDAPQLGPELLLVALGAAAVGGFVSVPAACLGGLGLGLVEQLTQYWTHNGADALLAVF